MMSVKTTLWVRCQRTCLPSFISIGVVVQELWLSLEEPQKSQVERASTNAIIDMIVIIIMRFQSPMVSMINMIPMVCSR